MTVMTEKQREFKEFWDGILAELKTCTDTAAMVFENGRYVNYVNGKRVEDER